jgi:hypothetical protein
MLDSLTQRELHLFNHGLLRSQQLTQFGTASDLSSMKLVTISPYLDVKRANQLVDKLRNYEITTVVSDGMNVNVIHVAGRTKDVAEEAVDNLIKSGWIRSIDEVDEQLLHIMLKSPGEINVVNRLNLKDLIVNDLKHKNYDFIITGSGADTHIKVNREELIKIIEELIDGSSPASTVSSLSASRFGHLVTMRNSEKFEKYVKNLIDGVKTYQHHTEPIYYDYSNMQDVYHAILDLPPEYEVTDILSSDGTIPFTEDLELRQKIRDLILNSPQFPLLQHLLSEDEDLAIDTYISRRIMGGYSLLDQTIMDLQNKMYLQGFLEISGNMRVSGYDYKITRETVRLWQTEMYVFMLTGQPVGMEVSRNENIYRNVPILQPEQIYLTEAEDKVTRYLSSFYPVSGELEAISPDTYSPGTLHSAFIKRQINELTPVFIDENTTRMEINPIELYYLGFNVYSIMDQRMNLPSDHNLFINSTIIETLLLANTINKAIIYLSGLYKLIEGPGSQNLQTYLMNLYYTHIEDVHLLWSSFIFDYFGKPRDYTTIPKLSDTALLSAEFKLKVNNNIAFSDKSKFDSLLFGRDLDTFKLSDFVIGVNNGLRYWGNDIDTMYTIDLLRYKLVESDIIFVEEGHAEKFKEYWFDLMKRDNSGLSDVFTSDMIVALANSFIPLFTVYNPADPNKWTYLPPDEFNLAQEWMSGSLAKYNFKIFSTSENIHYKIHLGNSVDKYFEILNDLLKYYINPSSRVIQKLWMFTKYTASTVLYLMEKY